MLVKKTVFFIFFYVFFGHITLPAGSIEVKETEEGLWFVEDGQPVLFYQRQVKSLNGEFARNHYIHPLYDLDNQILTEDFPPDHPHHRGIFWAWHQVLIGKDAMGDSWSCTDFFWDVTAVHVDLESSAAILHATVLWKSPFWLDPAGAPKPFLEEQTEMVLYPRTERYRKIDFTIRLSALESGLKIGGSDDEKGYGGFSCRVRLPEDVTFTGQTGPVTPQVTAVSGGAWMDLSASYRQDHKNGLTILCHPTLPLFPPQWILRATGAMQNPVYPGRSAVALPQDRPLILRYRLLLHSGDSAAIDIPALYKEYSQE